MSKHRIDLRTRTQDFDGTKRGFLLRALEAVAEEPRVLVVDLDDAISSLRSDAIDQLRKAQVEGALQGVLVVFHTRIRRLDELLRSHGLNGVYGVVH